MRAIFRICLPPYHFNAFMRRAGMPGLRGERKQPSLVFTGLGCYNLATTYSRGTCRPTTIGAAAFHFRVRDGNGWFHRAMVTRGGSDGQLLVIEVIGYWANALENLNSAAEAAMGAFFAGNGMKR